MYFSGQGAEAPRRQPQRQNLPFPAICAKLGRKNANPYRAMAAVLRLTAPCCLQHDLLSLETCYRFLRLPAGLYGHKPFSRLMQRGLARLVEEFGDLDEVWTDEERQAAFLAMPLEAMQVGLTVPAWLNVTACR